MDVDKNLAGYVLPWRISNSDEPGYLDVLDAADEIVVGRGFNVYDQARFWPALVNGVNAAHSRNASLEDKLVEVVTRLELTIITAERCSDDDDRQFIRDEMLEILGHFGLADRLGSKREASL